MANIKKIYLGSAEISKVYAGSDLVYEKITDVTAPTTTARPAAGTYTTAQTVYLDVQEAADTYFTTDGSTPTTASQKYTAGIVLNADTTLKYFSVDPYGNTEAVKTSIYDINIPAPVTGYRYLKVEGYGAAETGQEVTSRIVEVEAYAGNTTNLLAGKVAISYQAISAGSTNIATVTDGVKTGTSNTYPLWWTSPTPNGNIVFDLGTAQNITELRYFGYSISGVQRTNRFKILGSNDQANWTTLWDNSTGAAGLQGILPAGYTKVL